MIANGDECHQFCTWSPSFFPPNRWRREDQSQHQYLLVLKSLVSQSPSSQFASDLLHGMRKRSCTPANEDSRWVSESGESAESAERDKDLVSLSNKRRKLVSLQPDKQILCNNSSANKMHRNLPPKLSILKTPLQLFEGAVEVDLTSISSNQQQSSTFSIAPLQKDNSIKSLSRDGKSLFHKLLNSTGITDLLEEEDHLPYHQPNESINGQIFPLSDSSNSTKLSLGAQPVSLGKVLTDNGRSNKNTSLKDRILEKSLSISRDKSGMVEKNILKPHSDRVEPFKASKPDRNVGNTEIQGTSMEFSLEEFTGIQQVCRNAGATSKGLEALAEETVRQSIDMKSKSIVAISFLFKDMTSNHATTSVKYCTESTTAVCKYWYCTCDRKTRTTELANSLIGVIFDIFPRKSDFSTQGITRQDIPFFLPLAPCLEPDSKERWRLDNGIVLPIQCETTVVDRWKVFCTILSSPRVVKAIYNMQVALLPVCNVIEQWNATSTTGNEWLHMFPTIFDPRIAEYLLNSNISDESLEILELQIQYRIERSANAASKSSALGMVARHIGQLTDELEIVSELYFRQSELLNDKSLFPLYWNIECPTACLLSGMELHGVHIDTSKYKEIKSLLDDVVRKISESIYESTGFTFNISSPEQVSRVLYDKLQLHSRVGLTGSKKYPSTSEEELQKLVHTHPVVQLILDFRSARKLLSTYIDGFAPFLVNFTPSIRTLNSRENKIHRLNTIHACWNQTAVRTGRLSCCKPNLQNIPGDLFIQGLKYNIRSIFLPRTRYVFVAADYSQIEMRILAHVSADSAMCELFRGEGDIYRLLASKILKKSPDFVTDEERTRAKVICLGVLYGMGPQAASTKLGIDVMTASKITNSFFSNFSQVKVWIHRVKLLAKQVGHVKTILGRIRPLPDINLEDSTKRSAAERQAVNSIIQGSASDLIKYAMVLATEKLFSFSPSQYLRLNEKVSQSNSALDIFDDAGPPRLVMQIHDELIFEVANVSESYVREVIATLTDVMEKDMMKLLQLRVPLMVNISVGKNWGDMLSWNAENSSDLFQKMVNC